MNQLKIRFMIFMLTHAAWFARIAKYWPYLKKAVGLVIIFVLIFIAFYLDFQR